jgi:hypothetical protein
MHNKILHSVTNRAGGFNTPGLLTSSEFHPSVETRASADLRHLMGLDYENDDYHVLAMLAAVEAHPDVFRAFQDGSRSYQVQDFPPPAPPVVSGGIMVSDAAGFARLQPVPDTCPVPPEVLLTYVSASAGGLSYGRRYEVLPCRVSDSTVFPTWPENLGISGGVYTTWSPGAQVRIYARPTSFPYQVMADTLQVASCKNVFLQQQGLLNHYYQAEDAQKKLAIVALALGLSNPAVYG